MKEYKVCKVEGCNNPAFCKGYCRKHYRKWYKYGNPCFAKRIRNGSIMFREGKIIKVIANNTKNIFLFDNTEEIFNKLKNKNFSELNDHYLRYGNHLAHHLVLPKKDGFDVDHINRDTRDNRISNLRYITHSENAFNSKVQSNNISGITGICWNKQMEKWETYIGKGGKLIYLGCYINKADAIEARLNAEEILFPDIKYREVNNEGC